MSSCDVVSMLLLAVLPGRTLPTPRIRSRTSLRLSHGYANPLFAAEADGEEPKSPNTVGRCRLTLSNPS